ncbi:ZPR1 zinc finger domain-containing protein [Candidatus Woesearchaeota archaeon]|nr:ZPR1 zinc finger domain-containing protein [Candidatus Woesearchaeota archaeon]
MAKEEPAVLKGQQCPICNKKTLSLIEDERNIPYFGKCYLFSMSCSSCHYHKADVEAQEKHPPARHALEISSEEDMNIRVIKSAAAVIKIPHMVTVEGGESSNGYITNVEGILSRIRKVIEYARDNEEDNSARKKAKNQLKKLQRVMWGQEKLKLIIDDKTGNSAIISEKAAKTKL